MRVLRSGSKELIKDINRFKVLNIIRKQYPISRSEISKRSELGISTLSYIIEDLKEQDYICEVGEASSTGGRRAKLLEFNKDYGLVISIKIEEKQILTALANMEAEIIDIIKTPIKKKIDPIHAVSKIEEQIYSIFEKNKKELSKLYGIGVLSSGLVNRNEGSIIRSSMLDWEDVPITKMLKEKFPKNVQVFVDNNINGYTLSELEEGEGQSNSNLFVVSVGAGLGLSIVVNQEIYYGSFGGAGEFGHTTIEIDGYPCHCGQNGCLEMYASEFYFENKGKELSLQYPETTLKNFQFAEVAKKAEQKDELANQLINEMSIYLGYGIRNLINTFNPDKIIMAGEGMKYSHLFMENVRSIAQDNFFSKVEIQTNVISTRLEDNAWLTGGALLAINHIFKEPIYEDRKTKVL